MEERQNGRLGVKGLLHALNGKQKRKRTENTHTKTEGLSGSAGRECSAATERASDEFAPIRRRCYHCRCRRRCCLRRLQVVQALAEHYVELGQPQEVGGGGS